MLSFIVSTKKKYEKDSAFYRFLLNHLTAIALKLLGIKVHVTGFEKVPKDTKVLFVGNHRSCYDPIISWYIFRKWKPAFISKPSNFKIPIFGRYIRKCCFMAIDRENPRNALKTIIDAAELIKKDEVSVGVYPEGTRSKNCELLPFHNGVFKIAQRANVPIIVLAVDGTEKIHKNYLRRITHVYLTVAEVLDATDVKAMKTDEIGTIVNKALEKELKRT